MIVILDEKIIDPNILFGDINPKILEIYSTDHVDREDVKSIISLFHKWNPEIIKIKTT